MAELYYVGASPPCRAVAITAKILGVDFSTKIVDLTQGAHMQKDFLAINPEHTVPVFTDGGEVFFESRAIMKQLVRKYGKGNHQLYPSDINKQYQIDRYLDFDLGTFFGRFKAMMMHLFKKGKPIPEEAKQHFIEGLGFLEAYLEGKEFITGDEYTLADISLATLASQVYMARIDMSSYSNVNAWLERCIATIPHFKEVNDEGSGFKTFVDAKFKAIGL